MHNVVIRLILDFFFFTSGLLSCITYLTVICTDYKFCLTANKNLIKLCFSLRPLPLKFSKSYNADFKDDVVNDDMGDNNLVRNNKFFLM